MTVDTQSVIAWSVAGILVCNVLALVGFTVAIVAVMRVAKRVQQEIGPAVQAARTSLAKVEALTESTDTLMRESLRPVLTNVEESTHAINQSAAGVRRMVVRVEDAIAKPIALVATAGNVLETPAGK